MVAVQLHDGFTYKLFTYRLYFYLFRREVWMIWGVTKTDSACIATNKKPE